MKEDDLYRAVTELPDELVAEGEKPLNRKPFAALRRWGALAAVLAVVIWLPGCCPGAVTTP